MRRRFWLSSGSIFLDETVYTALVPLLPLVALQFGLSTIGVGFTVAAYPLLFLVAALPTGLYADRVGVRRVLLIGSALLVVATLGFAFAETAWQLWAARAVQGLASGMTSVAGMAAIAGGAAAGRRGTMIGFAGALTGLSTFAGPALGGFGVPALGLEAAFLIPAALGVIVLVGLALPGWLEPGSRSPTRPTTRDTPRLLRNPFVRASMACILADALVGGAAATIVPLRLAADGYSTSQLGALLIAGAALGLLVTLSSGRMADTRGVGTVASGWALAMLAVAVGLAVSPLAWLTAALYVALLPLLRAGGTIGFALGARGAPLGGGLGLNYGLMLSAWALGAVVGPLVAGAVADVAGSRTGLLVAALAAAALTPVVVASRHHQRPECAVGA